MEREFNVHYTKNEKFHLKDFPIEIVRSVPYAVDGETSRFSTEESLVSYYTIILERFHELISKTKKVIAYRLCAPEKFKYLPGVTPEMAKKLGYAGGRDENIFGFTIEYYILMQQTDNGISYRNIDRNGTVSGLSSIGTHGLIVIDYTEEREAFFESIKKSMQEMFVKVISIMEDGDKLSLMIDQGGLKLLG